MTRRSQYLIPTFFILFWWYFAFFSGKNLNSSDQITENGTQAAHSQASYNQHLSTFSREEIHQALSGDIPQMTKLMREWDIDARILENQGVGGIQKLDNASFVKAQLIGRSLQRPDGRGFHLLDEERDPLDQNNSDIVYDDQENPFPTNSQFKRFLPQTFVAASFLFALTTPGQIVAIPSGLRKQTALYPLELTSRIPLNTDRIYSEHLYKKKPDVAFVADYSHPATLEMLKNQRIPLFTLNGMKTEGQIKDAIRRIGKVANCARKAELLALFIESAMIAIDNRLAALKYDFSQRHDNPKIMFLNHFDQFSVPTDRTITGNLLNRLELLEFNMIPKLPQNNNHWSIPIDQESIVSNNPDFLIIATHDQDGLFKQIINHPAFANLNACRYGQVQTVDNIPHAPTQFIVLAYFDIANALLKSYPEKSGNNPDIHSACLTD